MFGFGRKRGLREWVLMILQRGPKNGAEVMDAMESMSQGWWRPSPGSVYPLLEELTQEGLIRRNANQRYEVTGRGRDASAWASGWFGGRARGPKEVVDELESYVAYLEDLARTDREREGVTQERPRLKKLGLRIQELAS